MATSGDGDLVLPPNFLVKSSTLVFLSIFLPERGLTSGIGGLAGAASLWLGLAMGEGPRDDCAEPSEPSLTLSPFLLSNLFIRFDIRVTFEMGLFGEELVSFCCC